MNNNNIPLTSIYQDIQQHTSTNNDEYGLITKEHCKHLVKAVLATTVAFHFRVDNGLQAVLHYICLH